MTKKKALKKTMRKAKRTLISVAENIGKDTVCGTYRARKFVNGKRVSKNFTNLKIAKSWLNSL